MILRSRSLEFTLILLASCVVFWRYDCRVLRASVCESIRRKFLVLLWLPPVVLFFADPPSFCGAVDNYHLYSCSQDYLSLIVKGGPKDKLATCYSTTCSIGKNYKQVAMKFFDWFW